MTQKEKVLLENKLYHILKESFFGGEPLYYEKKDDSDSESYDDDNDDDNDSRAEEKYGIKIIPDGDSVDKDLWNRARTILPVLQDTNDNSVNSFNLTRSQLAYELWPELDKDAARSKLSQKIEGNKSWQEKEINKLELAKEVFESKKVKEAEKQKGIWSMFGSFEIVRN